jgi:spore coat polysaccharide biosynthesis predicted glycosyltransferase SpsG
MDVLNAANDFQSQNELKSQLFDLLLFTLTSENNDITRKLKRKFIKQIKEFKTKNKDKFNKIKHWILL